MPSAKPKGRHRIRVTELAVPIQPVIRRAPPASRPLPNVWTNEGDLPRVKGADSLGPVDLSEALLQEHTVPQLLAAMAANCEEEMRRVVPAARDELQRLCATMKQRFLKVADEYRYQRRLTRGVLGDAAAPQLPDHEFADLVLEAMYRRTLEECHADWVRAAEKAFSPHRAVRRLRHVPAQQGNYLLPIPAHELPTTATALEMAKLMAARPPRKRDGAEREPTLVR